MPPGATATARTAAFFDVDGTLAATHIAHYYAYFRRRLMSPLAGRMWYPSFLVKCLYYLWLDRIDRNRLNVVFYRSYGGLPVEAVHGLADDCYGEVLAPRRFNEADAAIEAHREAGRDIVLVTGSLDFVIRPLARELGVSVLAPGLAEAGGRFTGELTGPPIAGAEKGECVRGYAAQQGIDLPSSHAYGDSIADLAMLESVGHAHVVNPDKRLARIAASRGWTVHSWTTRRGGGNVR